MNRLVSNLAIVLLASVLGVSATAQTNLGLTDVKHDRSLPVEAAAKSLSVDSSTNTANFSGDATVVQGALSIAADNIVITYNQDDDGVQKVFATGNLTFRFGQEKGTADEGEYVVSEGKLFLSGNVRFEVGPNNISGDRLELDLVAGSGRIEGNVTSIFVPKSDE